MTHKCQDFNFHSQFIHSTMNCAKKGLIWLSRFKSEYLLHFGQNMAHWWTWIILKWPLLGRILKSQATFILSTIKCVEKLSHFTVYAWKCVFACFELNYGQFWPKVAPNWASNVKICNHYAKFILSVWPCVKKWSH